MHKYEDVRCIGRGSYGSAHLVIERTTSQRFVIKKIPMELLNENEKAQSFREVELLSKLKHPNVVEYKESFVENNVINIVMAYCDGGDLAGRIKERAAILANGGHGYFDTRQIMDWFVQMAMAIKYLHEQRILHRDLKTNNIFLTTENVIKLGDFGIAKTLDSTLDQAKTVVGTPYYMSPEVCESKPYSYASDVWSLGCVLYEIVALRHAFEAPNILMLVLKIVQKDFAAVPAHYDPEISEILKRLLDKCPEKRMTMDQIFLMPYVRNHMQALAESGGSLKMSTVARRPHGTPKRRVPTKNGRRSSTDSSKGVRRSVALSSSSSTQSRWAAIAPNDREEVCMGDGSDLELLDTSTALDDSSSDLRLPERSKTPEPLVVTAGSDGPRSPPPPPPPQQIFHSHKPPTGLRPTMRRRNTPNAGSSGEEPPTRNSRRPSAEEVEEELDTRFQAEAAEALMNPNFQRVYAEECDDSLTVKYAAHSKARARQPQSNGKPPKPESSTSAHDSRRRIGADASADANSRPSRVGQPIHRQQQSQQQAQWGVAPRRTSARVNAAPLTLSLSLDESTTYDSEHLESSSDGVNLSDSGMLRQLEMEEASSGDDGDDDAYTSNSDEYDGEENFYSEHSAYSDDSDFAGEENETEYSDDFEELEGEVIEYANDEFAAEDEGAPGASSAAAVASTTTSGHHSDNNHPGGIRSPKLVSSPASRRPPREVQWVMRNVAQSLMESCDNLSVA